jgi:hypothetical protein
MIGSQHAISRRCDAIEAGKPDRAVEPWASVECNDGPPLPALVDVELDVADGDAH